MRLAPSRKLLVGKENGDVLAPAESEFDVLAAVDTKLRWLRNLSEQTHPDVSHPVLAHRARRGALPVTLRMDLLLLAVCLALSLVARADDFWKRKPRAEWSSAEALKLVRRSPWAKAEVVIFNRRDSQADYSVMTGSKHCDPDAIDANGNCLQKLRVEPPVDSSQQPNAAPMITPSAAILVRWESARPVAEAFTRLHELGGRAVIEFQAQSPRLPADRYVLTAKLEQSGLAGFAPFALTTKGRPVLHATLKTRQGAVSPLEVDFTGAGTSAAAHFFFPRSLNGTPLLGPGRDSADFNLQGAGFAVHAKFVLDPEIVQ